MIHTNLEKWGQFCNARKKVGQDAPGTPGDPGTEARRRHTTVPPASLGRKGVPYRRMPAVRKIPLFWEFPKIENLISLPRKGMTNSAMITCGRFARRIGHRSLLL